MSAALLERADLVAHHALEVVREAAGREEVGEAGAELGVGGRVGSSYSAGLWSALGADEDGVVGVLPVREGHEPVLGELRLAPVGDGDLGGALHVHAAVVGGEGVAGEALDHAARLDAADAGAPAVELEGAVDVDAHGVGGVGPGRTCSWSAPAVSSSKANSSTGLVLEP
jgi:hypothetical protein